MPNLLTGNHASQSDLILSDTAISQLDGLYCLNDLHRLSGNQPKHRPTEFLRSEFAKPLLAELERKFKVCKIPTPYLQTIIGKGKRQGTYVCKELVYAYAMWIDPRFYLMVLQVFDRVVNPSYTSQLNVLMQDLSDVTKSLSFAGRFLCVGGKQVKPAIQKQIDTVLDKQQLKLALGE